MIKRGVAAVITIAAACAISGPASASVPYDVYGCRLPDGSPAPVEGWMPSGASDQVHVTGTCHLTSLPSASRSLSASFSNLVPIGSVGAWNFAAPVDTMVVNTTFWRAVRPGQNASRVAYWYVSSDEARAGAGPRLEGCMNWETSTCTGLGSLSDPAAPGNRADTTGMRARQVNLTLACGGASGGCWGGSQFTVF